MATPVLYRAIWIPSAVLLAGMVTLYSVQPEAIPSVGESKTFMKGVTSSDCTLPT